MKALYIKIKNIGLLADETITLDKPLIIFYGEIRQGKTTILNCFRWVCGGSFPGDIIRHGEKEAEIEFGVDGGMIRREFYVSKKAPHETKARDVQYIKNGRPVDSPVAEIKRFLNPFLLNQDHLRNMTETERKKYFTDMFSVDTTDLDTEAFNANKQASDLRAKLTGYGEIDLTEVKAVDAAALSKQLADARQADKSAKDKWEADCLAIRNNHSATIEKINKDHAAKVKAVNEGNLNVEARNSKRTQCEERLGEIQDQILELQKKQTELETWLVANPVLTPYAALNDPEIPAGPELPAEPTPTDTTALEAQIQNAAAQNVRAEQYQKNLKRAHEKEAEEKKLAALEQRQREIKAEKIKKLATISESCGIKDLAFDETGQFTFEGTQAGMLSTSQIMNLSSQLSALYPEGLGVELLDRGESLGKSIFQFVDRAKADELTILATIVGEAPAKSPPEVGVFVVEAGKITPAKPPAAEPAQKELV